MKTVTLAATLVVFASPLYAAQKYGQSNINVNNIKKQPTQLYKPRLYFPVTRIGCQKWKCI
jgi:hypothetical protein